MNFGTISIGQTGSAQEDVGSAGSDSQPSDSLLLQAHLSGCDEEAFTTLVRRHWSLVFGIALRGTGDQALSKDIAQAVFILFDRKCATLSKNIVLAGWLFRTAMFTTRNALKAEIRRKERERCAASDAVEADSTPAQVWDVLSKDLDEGLATLSAPDRNALILRFIQNRSFRAVGEILGLNEHGARQRSLRALERLRKFFRKRGIVYPVTVLVAAFATQSVRSETLPNLDSAAARHLADFVSKELNRRKKYLLIKAFYLALIFLVAVFLVNRRNNVIDSRARRKAIEAVDRALWRGDGTAFATLISLPPADTRHAAEVLTRYCDAFFELRRSFDARFAAERSEWIGSLRLLSWMAEDRLSEQPVINSKTRAINSIVPGYSMHLVREGEAWKWDLFENATPAEVAVYLHEIERQTSVLNGIRRKIEAGDFLSALQVKQVMIEVIQSRQGK
jgi:RNA polymerase sigma factor (sigma-70 family)